MRFASLGSGSRGNGLIVQSGSTRVLLDCGFSRRDAERRLLRLKVEPSSLTGILVTHEHSDHLAGVIRLAAAYDLPVWLTAGTAAQLSTEAQAYAGLQRIDSHAALAVGDLEILPFPVPHDAREPVQYRFSDGARRLAVLTDCGAPTAYVCQVLSHCQGLVLECNHDPELLAASRYPAFLKRRIAGPLGHMSNGVAAELLGKLAVDKLQHIVAAHLSEQNNRPALAVAALAGVLGCEPEWVGVAGQEEGFGWRDLLG